MISNARRWLAGITQTLGRILLPNRPRLLRALTFELAAAEARERERIANGLHDDLGQVLAMVRFKLDELALTSDASGASPIQELQALVAQATEATRHATFELRSPVLQQLGLQAALENLAQRMQGMCGLRVELRGQLPGPALPGPVQTIVFRVVRELLFNVHKHAQASRVVIGQGGCDRRLHILVQDDGVGFEPAAGLWRFSAEGGYGLPSAQAQIAAVGGELTVMSRPGHGTRVQLWLPLDSAPAGQPFRSRHQPVFDNA